MEQDEDGMEINRRILEFLVKGKGKVGIDELDNVNDSTPLQVACENSKDIKLI